MRLHTVTQLGKRKRITREGYVVYEEVPLGRVGEMLYAKGEIPLAADSNGMIRVTRDAGALFDEDTIASFAGKPLTLGHPPVDVTPENWETYAKGIIVNPRRGTNDLEGYLVGDIMVTNAATIRAIDSGTREISLGYDADYIQTGVGRGNQLSIFGNHGALVRRGRCGTTCKVRDLRTVETDMPNKTWAQRIRDAFSTNDEDALETVLNEGDGDDAVHVHLHAGATAPTLGKTADCADDPKGTQDAEAPAWFKAHVESNNKRFDALEAKIGGKTTDAAPAELLIEVPTAKTTDAASSAILADVFRETVSFAEILAPGMRVGAFDPAAPATTTLESLKKARGRSLDLAYSDRDTRPLVESALDGRDLASLSHADQRIVFKQAATLKRAANNASQFNGQGAQGGGQRRASGDPGNGHALRQLRSNADINKANREFWAKQGIAAGGTNQQAQVT